MNKDLKTVFVKVEASRGAATGAGSTTTLIDANQSWVADKVKIGQVIRMISGSNVGEESKITGIDTGTDTATVSPAFSTATAIDDRYEIITDGGAMTSKSDVLAWMFPSGTAEAGSGPTTIIDVASNGSGEWANKGYEVGQLVYVTGGGGVGGKGVITAIDYTTSTLTITSITGSSSSTTKTTALSRASLDR